MTVPAESAPGTAAADDRRHAWWRAGLLFTLTTGLLFALQFDTVSAMVSIWVTSDTFGYCLLILPIVAFLIYQRRQQLAALMPRPCYWALIWIAGALLLYLIGSIGSVMLFKQLAFVGLWQGLFVLIMGAAVLRQMIFPLFFLVFVVPMGAEVVPLLQRITAEICVFLLRASGMPTFLSGILIEIPTGTFVVAEICSGARFLITALVLGTLATHLFFHSWWRRILFMSLCLVVPILANGLRAYGIIMLAHLSDYQLAVSVDHIVYGLIFLSLVLIVLTGLGALFRDRWPEAGKPGAVAPAASSRLSSSLAASALAILLLGGGEFWVHRVTSAPETAGPVVLAALEPGGDWRLVGNAHEAWHPDFPGADTQVLSVYEAPEGTAALFVAHYLYQRDGHEIISVRNSFIGRGPGRAVDRNVTGFKRLEVELAARRHALFETVVQTPEETRLIWFWYDIGGTPTTSAIAGKLLEIWHTLSGGSRAATAFAVSTAADHDLRDTRARLRALLDALDEGQGLTVSLAQSG